MTVSFRPDQIAFMHIDVQGSYAINFGKHWHQIEHVAKCLRRAGSRIIGITYDREQPARYLPGTSKSRKVSLIAPSPEDFCYSKQTVSALGQGGDGRLRTYLETLPALGVKAVLLGGYYSGQCVINTAQDMSRLNTGLIVFAVDSLCRAHPELGGFDLPQAMRRIGGQAVVAGMRDGQVLISPAP